MRLCHERGEIFEYCWYLNIFQLKQITFKQISINVRSSSHTREIFEANGDATHFDLIFKANCLPLDIAINSKINS